MSTTTWKLSDLFDRAGATTIDGAVVSPVQITSLTDDSRQVARGSCFVAVPGSVNDGASFIDAALAAGAAAIVVGPGVSAAGAVAVVRVADPREALAKLAAAYYGLRGGDAIPPKLIGVTGTNGKTTVTWLLRAILQAAGQKAALFGTVEYDLVGERCSAPLTTPGAMALCRHLAAARDAGASHAVFEVSSHALDQRRCDGLTFAAGVFTNITGDHLDYHKTMGAYASAKRRLFEMLPHDAVAAINADDPLGASFADASTAPVVTFGIDAVSSDVRADIVQMDGCGTRLVVHGRQNRYELRTSLVGKHNVSNLLAAAATAEALGVAPHSIRDGLEHVSGVPGRLQRVESDGSPFSVLVDYAHTDDALRNVLRAMRPITTGRLICVFGCGGDRDRTKRPRMAAAVGELADIAFVTSDNPRTEDANEIIRQILPGFAGRPRCRVAVDADRRAAIFAAVVEAHPGDMILIAGKGHETYQLVGDRVLPFDDVSVARAALSSLGAGFADAACAPPRSEAEMLKEERVA
jgi:UDP-N-acetylmuramoyl-L-alanyl-D-glutamate--2,6-diaminopimelate ligase